MTRTFFRQPGAKPATRADPAWTLFLMVDWWINPQGREGNN